MKKNLLLNNRQDANEVRISRKEWIFLLGSSCKNARALSRRKGEA